MIDCFCFLEDHEDEADSTEMLGYIDLESAAIDYAEGWDKGGDYIIAQGSEEVVVAWDKTSRKRFRIRAEQSIDYFATEIEDDK